MKNVKIIGSFLIIGAFLSCDQESGLTDNQKYEIIHGVKQLAEQFLRDYEAEDLNAVMSHLDTSMNFFWVYPPYTGSITREIYAKALRSEFEMNNPVRFVWDTIQVIPLSGNLAYYQGRAHQIVTDTSEIDQGSIAFESAVVILRDDGWKLLSGQTYFVFSKKE